MELEDTEEEELEDEDSIENDEINFKPEELTNLDALKKAVRQKKYGTA